MKNTFDSTKIIQFQRLCAAARTIAVVSHTNPDGDAIGSGLALSGFLRNLGHDVRFFVPNRFPKFLDFIPGSERVEIYNEACAAVRAYISSADLIICADFNRIERLDKLSAAVEENIVAPRVLIDHHLNPAEFELAFSDTDSSSTAQLVYELILAWAGVEAITPEIALPLYVGMTTDTGNFSYGNLTPELYRAVAVLVERGVRPIEVSQAVFNTQSENRLRMVGYLLSEKMRVHAPIHTAYITLTRAEKTRFDHQIGDTEGIVNMPLSIDVVSFSAMFIETLDCIKLSFRSKGAFDVDQFARRYFDGGGHRNAAGGRYYGPMSEAVARFEQAMAETHPED
ncbi:bifunctional oligoribonuclease/PAP phosphatase NrnA [uncultured Rikenella sp.]|uniref:DHH family phosphoesterase n=1 Tax=uncultured Rikenella sp. TaxID=368003 RepID=UPI0026117C4C|nr:bifunctional oligoribonuclease/PAP phosphatase NrnA [uncultured Rikenella sp.]